VKFVGYDRIMKYRVNDRLNVCFGACSGPCFAEFCLCQKSVKRKSSEEVLLSTAYSTLFLDALQESRRHYSLQTGQCADSFLEVLLIQYSIYCRYKTFVEHTNPFSRTDGNSASVSDESKARIRGRTERELLAELFKLNFSS
jgi:hypothetical protein